MKILVYGANGWIGSQFLDFLLQTLDLTLNRVIVGLARLDQVDKVIAELTEISPTHVISLIGRTTGVYEDKYIPTIDYLEKPGKLVDNVRDNLYSPMILALLAKKYKYHFTYLSTGCIYEYDDEHIQKGKGFAETDEPNFTGSSYSIVKNYTDRLCQAMLKEQLSDILVLRIRLPVTDNPEAKNLITKLIKYEYICSIDNSVTILPDFFKIFLDMMAKEVCGVFNCTNPGYISHNDILSLYREIVDNNFTWKTSTLCDQEKKLGNKRSNCFLDTSLLESMYDIPPIKDSMRIIMQKYRKNLDKAQ